MHSRTLLLRSALRNDYFVRSFVIGRWVDVDELVGTNEIADRLGYSRGEHINTLMKRRPDFPQPLTRINTVYVWAWPDVEAWARQNHPDRLP